VLEGGRVAARPDHAPPAVGGARHRGEERGAAAVRPRRHGRRDRRWQPEAAELGAKQDPLFRGYVGLGDDA